MLIFIDEFVVRDMERTARLATITSPPKNARNSWVIYIQRGLTAHTRICGTSGSRLNVEFGRDHPEMRVLLEKLKYIDFEARCTLRWITE
ncbi:hypothetical protein OSTOST_04451, partial [Ostertagia ostertagi]